MFFYKGKEKLGGVVIKKVYWRKTGVQSIVASHWLGCDSLSLVGPLPGEEKIFLPPVGDARPVSSCLWQTTRSGEAWERLLQALPTPIMDEVSFIHFHKFCIKLLLFLHIPCLNSSHILYVWRVYYLDHSFCPSSVVNLLERKDKMLVKLWSLRASLPGFESSFYHLPVTLEPFFYFSKME